MSDGWTRQARERGAVAVVDLDAIAHNVARVGEAAGPAAVLAVVKADGYGHGLVPAARAAQAGGASWLGVALLSEALDLRGAGIRGPLLAWLAVPGAPWAAALQADVDVSAGALWALDEVVAAAAATGRTARLHLEADTGMSRAGAQPADWPDLVQRAAKAQAEGAVEVVGVWSHLACADTPDHPSVARQLARYADALAVVEAAGLRPQVRHLANSAAAFAVPQARYDLVRAGIATYGLTPGPQVGTPDRLGLVPAMSLRARLAQVKAVPAGEGVSYGHEYTTDRDTVVGLVPVGYADGLPRAAHNVGPVLVDGRVLPVAGRVCMDQLVLDLGPSSSATAGDEVVLFGTGAHGEPTADDWAAACGTIGYEIVTRIGARVPRSYVGSGA